MKQIVRIRLLTATFAFLLPLAVVGQSICPTIDQGWNEEDRVRFWYTSQGSQLMNYKAFLALESPGTTKTPLSSDLIRFRYLPMPALTTGAKLASELNPDKLPIGFAKDQAGSGNYVGFTCAACHTGRIRFQKSGTDCIVEGAPAMADFEGLLAHLEVAINETLADPSGKLARSSKKAGMLPKQFEAALNDAKSVITVKTNPRREHLYGFGRVDAFGQIFNTLMQPAMGDYRPADAPVSYPHLWDTPLLDRVQWNAAALNASIGPTLRNVGEALGVFSRLNVSRPVLGTLGYQSSIDLQRIGQLEQWVKKLQGPNLSVMSVDAPIDGDAAARGEQIYMSECVNCHHLPGKPNFLQVSIHPVGPETLGKGVGSTSKFGVTESVELTASSVGINSGALGSTVGTDSYMTVSFALRSKTFGKFAPGVYPKFSFSDLVIPGKGIAVPGNMLLAKAILYAILGKGPAAFDFSPTELPGLVARVGQELADVGTNYRARPLNGIWATAPYLHNGSVRSLRDLLNDEKERERDFDTGCLEYDVQVLGFVRNCAAPASMRFVVGPKDQGNSNLGHLWGTRLDPKDKEALLEYLKTL